MQTVAVGILANELVQMALRHAFPGDSAGTISVSFRREQACFSLRVADTGVGFQTVAGFGGPEPDLVRRLTRRLGAHVETEANVPSGAVRVVRFPADG